MTGTEDNTPRKTLPDLRSSITLALPHNVRTPLTGILTAAELIETQCEGLERHEIQRIAKIIQRSADRLHRLVQNWVLCAQIQVVEQTSGQVSSGHSESFSSQLGFVEWMGHMSLDSIGKMQGTPCAPAAAIAEATLQQAQHANRAADLTIELKDDTLRISEAHLKKIVEELVHNAFQYSEAGTPVRVTGSRRDDYFSLSVMDNGRGMTAEQIANAGSYMPFDHDCYGQQGMGLGLVIAKRLTALYGGKLTFESAAGQGTVAHLLLPV